MQLLLRVDLALLGFDDPVRSFDALRLGVGDLPALLGVGRLDLVVSLLRLADAKVRPPHVEAVRIGVSLRLPEGLLSFGECQRGTLFVKREPGESSRITLGVALGFLPGLVDLVLGLFDVLLCLDDLFFGGDDLARALLGSAHLRLLGALDCFEG